MAIFHRENRRGAVGVAFSVLIMTSLAIDITMILADYFCEGRVKFSSNDPEAERAALKQLATLIERELFEKCKEIFHAKFQFGKAAE